jgi:hypothetical protein
MKPTLNLFAAIAFAAVAPLDAATSALPKDQIAHDAKWVLHLDVEQFLSGKLGKFFLENILDKQFAQQKEALKRELNFELDWSKVRSVTAYGCGYKPDNDATGVIMIRSGLDLQAAFQAAIGKAIPGMNVQQIEGATVPSYSLNNDAFVTFEQPGFVFLSKHQSAIDKARNVIKGSTPNLTTGEALKGYPDVPPGFFLVALAEGFGQQADFPANAAILKQATGARIVLGESGDRLRLNVEVKTATVDVARQIQQVAQGLLALAVLNADQNPDLRRLTQAASISSSEKVITLGVDVPIADVIQRIGQHH